MTKPQPVTDNQWEDNTVRKKTEEKPSQDTPQKTTAKANRQLKQNRREPQPSPHKIS